jgi:hypothetical protein
MAEPALQPPVIETQVILARHHGRCDACRGAVRVGEEVQRVSGNWHHAECVPADGVEGWRDQSEAA